MKLAAALCVLGAFAAAAAPDNELRLDLGVASAVGFGGLTYTRTLTDRLSLEAGVGLGISGVQLSAMPRLMFAVGPRSAFFIGLGPALSIKRLDTGDVGGAFRRTGEGVWLNGDCGFHFVAASGFTFSMAAGLAAGLWGDYLLSVPTLFGPDQYVGIRGHVSPQGRIGVGYAF